MIALWVLAAHFAGDYLLQSRRMAAEKLTDSYVRFQHVAVYTACFWPIGCAYADSWWQAVAFGAQVFVTHFMIDSFRFKSTIADWVEWRVRNKQAMVIDKVDLDSVSVGVGLRTSGGGITGRITQSHMGRVPLEPNPWPPMAILNDQALHFITLAALVWALTI